VVVAGWTAGYAPLHWSSSLEPLARLAFAADMTPSVLTHRKLADAAVVGSRVGDAAHWHAAVAAPRVHAGILREDRLAMIPRTIPWPTNLLD
jgi:hypothetical protein